MDENKNDHTFYRCSQHPSIIYTSLAKVKAAAKGCVEDGELNKKQLKLTLEEIDEWDGSEELEVYTHPTCDIDDEDCIVRCYKYTLV